MGLVEGAERGSEMSGYGILEDGGYKTSMNACQDSMYQYWSLRQKDSPKRI